MFWTLQIIGLVAQPAVLISKLVTRTEALVIYAHLQNPFKYWAQGKRFYMLVM